MVSEIVGLQVTGLAELRRDLRQVSKDAPKALQRANKKAAEKVAPAVRSAYGRQFQQRTGRSRRAIRAAATQTRASIRIGGKRRPYMIGQEFGSNRFAQFRPWTGAAPGGGRGSRGRFLYPTIRALTPEIIGLYSAELDRELAHAFPTRGTG